MPYTTGHLLLVVILHIPLHTAAATNDRQYEKKLLNDLLDNYDNRIKPYGVDNETFTISFMLAIHQIIDVDEKNQILHGSYAAGATWTDEDLMWDPDNYGGIDSIALPADAIWKPNMVLYNDIDVTFSQESTATLNLIASSYGQVIHLYRVSYKSSCVMSLKYFPFDRQNCTLTFDEMSYSLTSRLEISVIHSLNNDVFTGESSEFELTGMTEEVEDLRIHYHVVFQRRPLFYMVNILLPCTLITLVAMLGFGIPPEAGEKVGLGITVVLALTVFLLIVSDQMPPSVDIPLIGVYYFGLFLIVTLSTTLSVVVLSIHHKAPYRSKEVPRWIQKLLFGKLVKWLCMTSLFEHQPQTATTDDSRKNKNASDDSRKSLIANDNHVELEQRYDETSATSGDYKVIIRLLQNIKDRTRCEDEQTDITNQWRLLALILDRILLVIVMILNMIFIAWFVFHAAVA